MSDKLVQLLSREVVIPPFSSAAIKLGQITRSEDVTMEEIEEVILQMAGFSGFPSTWDGLQTLRDCVGDAP